MFAARAFWMTRRNAGLDSGLGPPFLTAIVISLPMRENSLDMRSQRANIVALRVSKMRPMGSRGLGMRAGARGRTARGGCGPRRIIATEQRFNAPASCHDPCGRVYNARVPTRNRAE